MHTAQEQSSKAPAHCVVAHEKYGIGFRRVSRIDGILCVTGKGMVAKRLGSMEDLPEFAVLTILAFMEVEDIGRCAGVARAWAACSKIGPVARKVNAMGCCLHGRLLEARRMHFTGAIREGWGQHWFLWDRCSLRGGEYQMVPEMCQM